VEPDRKEGSKKIGKLKIFIHETGF